MAGRVDDVDPVLAPGTGRRGRRDGDAALLLLLHPVHDRRTLMGLTDLVGPAGVEEDALGGRGLAGVDVRHDTEIAVQLERSRAGHRIAPSGPGLPTVVREGAVGLENGRAHV